MSQPPPALDTALQCYRHGDLRQAEQLCRRLLQSDANHAEAWLLLGTVCQDGGNSSEALTCFQKALPLRPQSAEVHFRLATAWEDQGEHELSLAAYRRAVQLQPDHAPALTRLAVLLAQGGQVPQAIALFGRAVQVRPDYAPAYHNRGVALAQLGRLEEAVASFRQAVQLRPDYAEAWHNLGRALAAQGRRDEAVAAYHQALAAKPDLVGAYRDLAKTVQEARKAEEAVVWLQQAARLASQAPEAHNDLGLALADLGRFPEAEACYRKALELDPQYAAAHANLGSTLKAQGRLEEALACYQLALWLEPGESSVRWNRSLTYLQQGDYERGWAEYEWRWQRGKVSPRSFAQPRWDGSPLAGRTVLVYMEQGLGDMVQFIRYTTLLKQAGATVVVECPSLLAPLFARCPAIDQVMPEGTDLPAFDVQVPLLSLPYLFQTTLATIPAEVPYLFPAEDKVTQWRQVVSQITGLRVGICWQGNPYHPWDRHRSVPLRQFAPLAAVPGVRLISLQKVFGIEQLRRERHLAVTELSGWDPTGGDFEETAAILRNLDLVVTVDTVVAHLAGALGVPAWLALATISDWRWLLEREDSPWYPSMRLFRQERLGDWREVFTRIGRELQSWAMAKAQDLASRPADT